MNGKMMGQPAKQHICPHKFDNEDLRLATLMNGNLRCGPGSEESTTKNLVHKTVAFVPVVISTQKSIVSKASQPGLLNMGGTNWLKNNTTVRDTIDNFRKPGSTTTGGSHNNQRLGGIKFLSTTGVQK